MLNLSHGGVMLSRFRASAKNENISSKGRGNQTSDLKVKTRNSQTD
jgi:hypothetical protein